MNLSDLGNFARASLPLPVCRIRDVDHLKRTTNWGMAPRWSWHHW